MTRKGMKRRRMNEDRDEVMTRRGMPRTGMKRTGVMGGGGGRNEFRLFFLLDITNMLSTSILLTVEIIVIPVLLITGSLQNSFSMTTDESGCFSIRTRACDERTPG